MKICEARNGCLSSELSTHSRPVKEPGEWPTHMINGTIIMQVYKMLLGMIGVLRPWTLLP
jgi:hypothetical protein